MQQIRRGVAEAGLGVRRDRAVADQEDRTGPRQRRRPQQRDAAQHDDDRRYQGDAGQTLLVVDGQPAVVDGQSSERLVAQAHTEPLVRGRAGRCQQGVPDLGPTGEAGEVLLALSAQEPLPQRGAECHRGHRGAGHRPGEEPAGRRAGQEERADRQSQPDEQAERGRPGMGQSEQDEGRHDDHRGADPVGPPAQYEQHGEPDDHGGVLSDLRRGEGPQRADQPPAVELGHGRARRDDQAGGHRPEHREVHPDVVPDEGEAAVPPAAEQPQRADEESQPGAAEQCAEPGLQVRAGDHARHQQQGEQEDEGAGPDA